MKGDRAVFAHDRSSFRLVDMLCGKTFILALSLLVVALLPLPGCALGDEREVVTNKWKFPWTADAVQVDYSPGLQTFVYTHRYPHTANVSDSSVAFTYYDEGLGYRPEDIVVLDPGPPGGANNTFIDIFFNESLMMDFQNHLCSVVAQLAGGVSGFVLGDEWPRGLNREEITVQRLSKYNDTYHGETGQWIRPDPGTAEKKALADWFFDRSIRAWNAVAWRVRSHFTEIHLGTNIDLVWESDYDRPDVAHWKSTDWWGDVDLDPYDFVVAHYYTKMFIPDPFGEGVEMLVDESSVARLRAGLESLLDPVRNVTRGRDVFLMLGAHCAYPWVITPMEMVREWNAALEFGDRLAGIGWFTFDQWIYGGTSIADFDPAPMSWNRLLTLRWLANLNRFGGCGGWILGPQVQVRTEPENITLVEGFQAEFDLIFESFGWEGELDLYGVEWSMSPDVVLDYDLTNGLPSGSGHLGFVGPGAGIRLGIRMKAPSMICALPTTQQYRYDPVPDPARGNLVLLVSPSTCKEEIGLAKVSSNPLYLSGKFSDLSFLSNLTNPDYLDLSSSQVCDLTPLSNLTELVYLFLPDNRVGDLTPLSGLTELAYLFLPDNRVGDLTPLSKLTNLASLDLSGNRVCDLGPLSSLTNLASLDLSDNQVNDLAPLSNLTELVYLFLSGNQVCDLTPLSNLRGLKSLYLSGNQVGDLTPLSNLTSLWRLDLSDNQVSDLSPLSNLRGLKSLYLSGNRVSDVSALVANSRAGGLGAGDEVCLENNYLDLSEGSKAMTDIHVVIDYLATVRYLPQRPVVVKEEASVAVAAMMAFVVMVVAARPRSTCQAVLPLGYHSPVRHIPRCGGRWNSSSLGLSTRQVLTCATAAGR